MPDWSKTFINNEYTLNGNDDYEYHLINRDTIEDYVRRRYRRLPGDFIKLRADTVWFIFGCLCYKNKNLPFEWADAKGKIRKSPSTIKETLEFLVTFVDRWSGIFENDIPLILCPEQRIIASLEKDVGSYDNYYYKYLCFLFLSKYKGLVKGGYLNKEDIKDLVYTSFGEVFYISLLKKKVGFFVRKIGGYIYGGVRNKFNELLETSQKNKLDFESQDRRRKYKAFFKFKHPNEFATITEITDFTYEVKGVKFQLKNVTIYRNKSIESTINEICEQTNLDERIVRLDIEPILNAMRITANSSRLFDKPEMEATTREFFLQLQSNERRKQYILAALKTMTPEGRPNITAITNELQIPYPGITEHYVKIIRDETVDYFQKLKNYKDKNKKKYTLDYEDVLSIMTQCIKSQIK